MTAGEWEDIADPVAMLEALRGRVSGRKITLFAAACCRHDQILMSDRRSRRAVEWAERWADRTAKPDDARSPTDGDCFLMAAAANHCLAAGSWAYEGDDERAFDLAAETAEILREGTASQRHVIAAVQAKLLKELVGDPNNSFAIESAWLTWNGDTVLKLAQRIYEKRAFEDLLILGDALQDAGCSDARVLRHCYERSLHVRGCWLVDQLLGKI